MAENGNETGAPPAPQQSSEEQQSVVDRVVNLPLLSSAYGMMSTAYSNTKESHPYLRSMCTAAEVGVKTLGAAAATGSKPLLDKLEPQIATANEYACMGLNKLEEKLPILQQPTEKVVADTRELQLEPRTLAMLRSLTLQLRSACGGVVSSVQGLPQHVQEQLAEARRAAEQIQSSLGAAGSFGELSAPLLAQSRQQLTQVRQSFDVVVEYLLNNTPLNWLVGPFAPQLVEKSEGETSVKEERGSQQQ